MGREQPLLLVGGQAGGHAGEPKEDGAADKGAMLAADRAAPRSGRSYREVETCPRLTPLPLYEARANSATGQRAALLQEYMGYIQRVGPGQAGRLGPGEGETTQALRRRLTAAAEALGKELQVRRSANAVYFWAPEGRQRGRPRKNPVA